MGLFSTGLLLFVHICLCLEKIKNERTNFNGRALIATIAMGFIPIAENNNTMDLQLTGKVFIVTGGAKGIGEGISKALAAEGAIPAIVGRSEEDNLKTV